MVTNVAMDYSPICIFAYNRAVHLESCVNALRQCPEAIHSQLTVFCDGAKSDADVAKVRQVRDYANSITGFAKVSLVFREGNLGLANSIISGVTTLLKEHKTLIVVEDDLIVAKHFLSYMNTNLRNYENAASVYCISAYAYPIEGLPPSFFLKGADCWGWATWSRAWQGFRADGRELLAELKGRKLEREFDFDGTYPYTKMLEDQIAGLNNSWAIRWYASAFLADKLCLYPGKTLSQNIGFDGSGTHCGIDGPTAALASDDAHMSFPAIATKPSDEAYRAFARYFRRNKKNALLNFFVANLKRVLHRLKSAV